MRFGPLRDTGGPAVTYSCRLTGGRAEVHARDGSDLKCNNPILKGGELNKLGFRGWEGSCWTRLGLKIILPVSLD